MALLPFEKMNRTILVRKKTVSNPSFGQEPSMRSKKELLKSGIIVVNKAPGPTSHRTAEYVKKILKQQKAGHSGTLDPNVSGVLPIALGPSTRVLEALLKAGKEYVCIMHLHKVVSRDNLDKAFAKFIGRIQQLPPVRSAVKRQIRYKTVYYIEVLEVDDKDVLFKIGCQAGTYIRKICDDMGKELGVGAHMAELIRTKVGPFNYDQSIILHDLADEFHYFKEGKPNKLKKIILPVEEAIKHLPKVWVLDSAVKPITHGIDLNCPGISMVESEIMKEEMVAVLTLKGELVALGLAKMTSKEMVNKKQGKSVLIDKVLMDSRVYPKI